MVQGRATLPESPPIIEGFDLLADLGDGLLMYNADLSKLREQDVNARIMPAAEFAQMVANIKKRGRLESVPYCVLSDSSNGNNVVETVSGHHRIKAAREAGITHAPILLDSSGLSRSEIVAKQLAHNRLVGFDDKETLSQLFTLLDSADDILESGLAGDLLDPGDDQLDKLIAPKMNMDWKQVTFMFLPHQLDDLTTLLDSIGTADLVAVASIDQFEEFLKAAVNYGKLKDIRNAGMAVALLTTVALREIAESEAGDQDDDETRGETGEEEAAPVDEGPAP
jgi:hypothetical protein